MPVKLSEGLVKTLTLGITVHSMESLSNTYIIAAAKANMLIFQQQKPLCSFTKRAGFFSFSCLISVLEDEFDVKAKENCNM